MFGSNPFYLTLMKTKRRLLIAILILISAAIAYSLFLYFSVSTPEVKAQKAFRQKLAKSSPNWHAFELNYSPSPGCGYTATAL
jgi:hypothetical protein